MLVLSLNSLPCRRFYGSSYFVPPHKRLLNRRQHSFPTLSQSRCTFQILQSWPWLQGNPITTRSAWNFENLKPSWPLINVRLRAVKVRFTHHASHHASKNNVRMLCFEKKNLERLMDYTVMSLTNPHTIRCRPTLKYVERFRNESFHEFCSLKA